MATDIPTPNIGDIKGEISIAPMMTAVEFVSKPSDASKAAHNKIQRLYPLKETPSLIVDLAFSKSEVALRSKTFSRNFFMHVFK
jgi:hypothetical protein